MSGSSSAANRRISAGLVVLLVSALLGTVLRAARSGAAQSTETPEVTSHDTQPNFGFHVQHNEVMVRVIVRDSHGKLVSNLKQADFRIFDNRKPQIITHFAWESAGTPEGPHAPIPSTSAGGTTPPTSTAPIILPRRFMALYFDDVHLEFGDLARTRNAAERYLVGNLEPGDRAGVFTSSGQDQLDFTDDRQQLHDAVFNLKPRPVYQATTTECPQMSTDQAYKMVEQHDPYATQIAYEEAFECTCLSEPPAMVQQCQQRTNALADAKAVEVLQRGESQTQYAMQGLEHLCQRMAAVPGQRSIVVLSPGFFTKAEQYDIDHVIDQALRQNIVISTLDARGLYAVPPLGDASQEVVFPAQRPDLTGLKAEIQQDALRTDADVLEQLADQTGGSYFHNSNDFGAGFRLVGAFPDSYYVLAFAPQDLKLDGRLHTLKVALADNPDHYTLQARRGYFAPNKAEDTATLAKEELEQLIFSQEELHAIPVEVHTQFFKPTAGDAKLSVVTHVDIRGVPFRNADGRNIDNVTVVTALFDHAGNYVTGEQKQIEFHLRDATLARLSATGLNMKASLPVKSGSYLIREIVRESEGDQLSALSSQVDIP